MRVSLLEYSDGIKLDSLISRFHNISDVKELVRKANYIIQQNLKINRDVLIISNNNMLRALGIAGTIRITKDIELEIIPKIYNNTQPSNWKETLFLLSALSKHGSIISSEHIHSKTAYKDALYEIAGRILSSEYLHHRRKPIRQYFHKHFCDFQIDGYINFDDIFEKHINGFHQTQIIFDKKNQYNATIKAAMQIVLPYIKDLTIQKMIIYAIQDLGEQDFASNRKLTVPARNKEWTNIYNLSFDICSGMGNTLENGNLLSPSFIVDTWKIWEWFVTITMKIGLGNDFRVIPQSNISWGKRNINHKILPVKVSPDITIYNLDSFSEPLFLLDAKYKILQDDSIKEIDRADLYEAFAFCHATNVKKLFLVYPCIIDENTIKYVSLISDYIFRDIHIYAIKVKIGAITRGGDITSTCKKIAQEIFDLAI